MAAPTVFRVAGVANGGQNPDAERRQDAGKDDATESKKGHATQSAHVAVQSLCTVSLCSMVGVAV